jgi:hypothetical protein
MMTALFKRSMGLAAMLLALAVPASAATVTIAWDANPEPDVTSYNVYIGTAPSPPSGQNVGNRLSWTFTGLQSGRRYYFAVQARSNAGTVSPRAEISFIVPGQNPAGSEASRADYNGDGLFDLLWQNRNTGHILAWHMNGPTVVGSRNLTPAAVAPGWKMMGSGDLNFDGKADIIWHNQNVGDVVFWLMDGVFQWSAGFFSATRVDPRWQLASVRDMNLDGRPDFVWHNTTTGQLLVWFLNGSQVVSAQVPNPAQIADTNWKLRGTADFDRNGRPDFLWHNEATGELRYWPMNGLTATNSIQLIPATVGPNWKIVAVGDATRDGWPDIFWENTATGQLVLWGMMGRQAVNAWSLSTPTVDPNYQITGPR